MKNIYILLFVGTICNTVFAQDNETNKADILFTSYQYADAIEKYLKLVENKNANGSIYSKLADCYYTIFNPEEASKWYLKAVESKFKLDAETYYRFAQTLKSLGRYKEANNQMETFSKLSPNDDRAKEYKKNSDYILILSKQNKLFDIEETTIKAKNQSNFGAFLANDNTLFFASTRSASKKIDKWSAQPYLDIFKSIRSANGTLSEPVAVSELNTTFHDGPVTVSADGSTMYFARDGHSEGQYQKNQLGNIKVGQQGLYKATKIGDKWSNIQALPFNSIKYSVTNPSLSSDGKTLYFASNMPGGIGESDIWKVTIHGDSYSKPENLGENINTQGKENFPFITEDNTLYFASTGKPGFGGFDIFKINLSSSQEAQNLGKPVNSEKDDFALSFNKKANVGYFSSNRAGSDAIFSAIPVCKSQALIVVTNKKTGAVIKNANLAIMDAKGNTIETKQSNSDGKATYDMDCNTIYTVQVADSNFDTATFLIDKTASKETIVLAQLNPYEVLITDREVILKNVFFDFNKSNITAQGANELDKLVIVMQENPTMVIFVKSHTDSKGKPAYNLTLSEQRAQSTVQYLISKGIPRVRVSGKGFGNAEPKINCLGTCGEEEHAQNRRSEFLIIKK